MQIFDIIILSSTVYLAYKGHNRGLIGSLIGLIGVLIGIVAAFAVFREAALVLESNNLISGKSLYLMAFLLVFCSCFLMIWLIGKVLKALMSLAKISVLDKLLGACLGLLQAIVLIKGLWLAGLQITNNYPEFKLSSQLYPKIDEILPTKANWLEELQASDWFQELKITPSKTDTKP